MAANWTLSHTTLPSELAALQIAIIIFILVGNVLVIITFKRMRALKIQHYFMIALSVTDIVTGLNHCVSAAIMIAGHVWLGQPM